MLKEALTSSSLNLTRRYLIWCYKTTKEELDRIDRYFTQNTVDQFLLKTLQESSSAKHIQKHISDFESYMDVKYKKALDKKFQDVAEEKFRPEYVYLTRRLEAIEKAIVHFGTEADLKDIQNSYEQEYTRRIWEAREHA